MHPQESFSRLPLPRCIRVQLVQDSIVRTFGSSGLGAADAAARACYVLFLDQTERRVIRLFDPSCQTGLAVRVDLPLLYLQPRDTSNVSLRLGVRGRSVALELHFSITKLYGDSTEQVKGSVPE